MIRPLQLIRLIKIFTTLLRFGLNRSVIGKRAKPLRALSYLNPWSFQKIPDGRGESLCTMLEKLGPVFVKFGQVLSTRRDQLPEDIADALAKLQDQVAPFSGNKAIAIIESELGKKIDDVFTTFDATPLAAASVAQVHSAEYSSGKQVIVKVLRPGIHKIIKNDLSLMYLGARIVERLWSRAMQINPVALVAEFEHTIIGELDLIREASNASQLKRNFADSKKMYVPEIYWDHTTSRVMVMERIYGIRISNVAQLKAAGTDLKKLAQHGVEIFFTQVLRDRFFHADMHPGNLFVDVTDPNNPVYLGVDFGIMGTLGVDDQNYLAKNLLAFFRRDYQRVAKLHVECGWVPADTRVDQFEAAIRAVSEPIFQKPLKEISFATLLLRLFKTAEQFNMQLQPQLMLLQKTLLNIEGLGRQLYPELDLWATAQPFLEKWLKEQHNYKELGKQAINDFPTVLEKAMATPELFHDVLHSMVQGMRQENREQSTAPRKTRKLSGTWFGFGAGLLVSVAAALLHPAAVEPMVWFGAGVGLVSLIVGAIRGRTY